MDVKLNASIDIDSITESVKKKLVKEMLDECREEARLYARNALFEELNRADVSDYIKNAVSERLRSRAAWEIDKFFRNNQEMSEDFRHGVEAGYALNDIFRDEENIDKMLEAVGNTFARRIRHDSAKYKKLAEAIKKAYEKEADDED